MGNGVILDTFREKEICRQSIIIYAIHSALNKFMNLNLSNYNVSHQIDSFIDHEIKQSAAMLDKDNIRWTAKSVQISWHQSKNAIDSAKAMLDFFAMRVSALEQYSRNFNRRQDWNASSKNNQFGYSLND